MFLFGPMIWIELIYSLIVIISCSIIHFRTKELYELSSYKGIKYFRNAFLFFGLAFFARFFLRLIAIIDGPSRGDFIFFGTGFLIFLYAGLMAGFYLIYSSIWKQFKNPEQFRWIFHPVALTIAAIVIIFLLGPSTLIVLGFIFFIAAILAYSKKKEPKKNGGIKQLHIIYILLFISWIASAAAHLFIRISTGTSLLLYGVSSLLFLVILYRVIESTKK